MTVDPELVTRKLLLIARDLDELAAIRDRGQDSYLASRVDQAVAERHLERMIGRMIDVNYHLLTGSGQAPPADYFGSFTQLASIGVVDSAFARELAACAGLRNRIVHDYDELDHARVFEAVGRALIDIPAYLGAVQRHLPKPESL